MFCYFLNDELRLASGLVKNVCLDPENPTVDNIFSDNDVKNRVYYNILEQKTQ